MVTLAHLSDVHYPLIGEKAWHSRWEAVVTRVRDHKPHIVIITGDIVNSGWPVWRAADRLRQFVQDIIPTHFRETPVLYVPGNHDVKFAQGLGVPRSRLAAIFTKLAGTSGGWHEPVGNAHVYTVDSNNSEWFARGRIAAKDLEQAYITQDCIESNHLHIFAMHHHIFAEPRRRGESIPTTDDLMLGLDDPARLLAKLAEYGFDIVLHGHRHLSTFHAYADPLAERRSGACWLVGAPSATKESWQGFNIIKSADDGAFEVLAVRQTQGGWPDPQLVASRNYEETRTRRWNRQVTTPALPYSDIVDVTLQPYRFGTEEQQREQDAGGDVQVEITLHGPERLGREFELPLSRFVGYSGTVMRGLSASWTDDDGHAHGLPITHEGKIAVGLVRKARDLRISAVMLNAIPAMPGDWTRMQASQHASLEDVVDLRLRFPARFLRVTCSFPNINYLQPVVHQRLSSEPLPAETEFVSTHHDGSARCHQEFLVFRPFADAGYALSSGGMDPVAGASATESLPMYVADYQRAVAQLLEDTDAETRNKIQRALDHLRDEVITIAHRIRNKSKRADDISADLLSITGGTTPGIQVVMTDSTTQARAKKHSDVQNPVGVSFPWGLGIVGRALRVQGWLTWTARARKTHVSAWPPEDWYYEVPGTGPHAHIFCGPLTTGDDEQRYHVAMLSFATARNDSLLGSLVEAFRHNKTPVTAAFDAAVEEFTQVLGAQFARSGATFDDAGDLDGDGE